MTQNTDGKYIFGTVKVGEKGQIVIPKDARQVFNINPGDSLVVLGDIERGLAIMKSEVIMQSLEDIMTCIKATTPIPPNEEETL